MLNRYQVSMYTLVHSNKDVSTQNSLFEESKVNEYVVLIWQEKNGDQIGQDIIPISLV